MYGILTRKMSVNIAQFCTGPRLPNLTPPGTPPLHSPKSREPSDNEVCSLLHIATISGVLGALMRHFRASLASLPLLGQAIGSLPIGTWSPDSSLVHRELNGGQQVTMSYSLFVVSLQSVTAPQ